MNHALNNNRAAVISIHDPQLGRSFPDLPEAGGTDALISSSSVRKRRWTTAGWLRAMLGLLLAFSCGNPGQAGEPTRAVVKVGFSKSIFLGVNQNDAQASFKAFLQIVGSKRGYLLESQVQIFDDTAKFEAAIKEGAVILAIVDSWSYLTMDLQPAAQPYFVSSENGSIGRKYVILTRRESGLKTLDSLRGKGIIELERANANLGLPWTENLLLDLHHGSARTFFGELEVTDKPSSAVLPVFFRKKDACVVDISGFDTMKELNPQVGESLQVVATSEAFVNNIICLSKAGWTDERRRRDMIETLGELHLEPAGQQILTLFKSGQLVPFQDSQLDTVRKLRKAYDHLRTKTNP